MFNMHKELTTFYLEHVNLTSEQRQMLAGYRDTNIQRLKIGLDKLGFPYPTKIINQGSYAMNTTNQHPAKDYDIDSTLIFEYQDLPANPLDARKRIQAAMVEGGGNFTKPPEARTNAVTVWYQEGHHVDLAIHRISTNWVGTEIIEHAGVEWVERDPSAITDWFLKTCTALSPSTGASVDNGQMRRIVQLIKMFSKSRESWNLPGGLLISVLVAECYVPDPNRDDVALYKTMEKIHSRLQLSTEVLNPVTPTQVLTYKDEYVNQVSRLGEQLGKALEWLQCLAANDCTRLQAVKAWKQFYSHQYWEDLENEILEAIAAGEAINQARMANSLFATQGGRLVTSKPEDEKAVLIPEHRFYGQ